MKISECTFKEKQGQFHSKINIFFDYWSMLDKNTLFQSFYSTVLPVVSLYCYWLWKLFWHHFFFFSVLGVKPGSNPSFEIRILLWSANLSLNCCFMKEHPLGLQFGLFWLWETYLKQLLDRSTSDWLKFISVCMKSLMWPPPQTQSQTWTRLTTYSFHVSLLLPLYFFLLQLFHYHSFCLFMFLTLSFSLSLPTG